VGVENVQFLKKCKNVEMRKKRSKNKSDTIRYTWAMTGITNPAIDEMSGPSIGQSSLDKKNRKKRAAENLSPELDMPG
jgi:hypothetical protein